MQKTCLKCGHANAEASGGALEACPQCGAIYSRVEAARAAKVALASPVLSTSLEEEDRMPSEPEAATISQRQMIGFLGAAVLAIGVFTPLMSGPMGLSVNFFSNGKGYGVGLLVLAACTAALVLAKRYPLLWATGGAALATLAFTYYRMQSRLADLKSSMDRDLSGNPFRGIADLAMASVQMQWGWAVLGIGIVLILACAGMKRG